MLLSTPSHLFPVSSTTHGNVEKINVVTLGNTKLKPIKYALKKLLFRTAPTTTPATEMPTKTSTTCHARSSQPRSPSAPMQTRPSYLRSPHSFVDMAAGNGRSSATDIVLTIR